jgi:hypothetical protein
MLSNGSIATCYAPGQLADGVCMQAAGYAANDADGNADAGERKSLFYLDLKLVVMGKQGSDPA